jgi:hypothetical protein
VINAEMLLFGATLGKHHVANIEVIPKSLMTVTTYENQSYGVDDVESHILFELTFNFNTVFIQAAGNLIF